MDRWLASLSRGALATLVIGGGILFIILSDPPVGVCDTQKNVFKENMTPFLFLDKKNRGI